MQGYGEVNGRKVIFAVLGVLWCLWMVSLGSLAAISAAVFAAMLWALRVDWRGQAAVLITLVISFMVLHAAGALWWDAEWLWGVVENFYFPVPTIKHGTWIEHAALDWVWNGWSALAVPDMPKYDDAVWFGMYGAIFGVIASLGTSIFRSSHVEDAE